MNSIHFSVLILLFASSFTYSTKDEPSKPSEHVNGTDDVINFFGHDLGSSILHADIDENGVYESVMEYYNQHGGYLNGTDKGELVKKMLKLLCGVPVLYGYYRVLSYFNEICANGGACSNVYVTTSISSTKFKSLKLIETAVSTSTRTKISTTTLSETTTSATTPVRTTTLEATSSTYVTTTETSQSTITTVTLSATLETFTFMFSETTTTVEETINTFYSTYDPNAGRLFYLFDSEDEEMIEISPTIGLEITSTYAWSKFSALMTSLETNSDGHDEWPVRESPTSDELDLQQFSQNFHGSVLESSKSSIDASVTFDDY